MARKGFWKKLHIPIFALAPMADVTDEAFRRMIARYGKPDVMWTEFVSCNGLCSDGRRALLQDLLFDERERPIVAQFFGATPEHFYRSALLARELGFDGIDINMGCPDKNIQKQNAGAKLILDPPLAKRIVAETKRGAGPLPVSIKTRIGYTKNIIDEWLPHVLETEPSAITIHGRTKKEMSDVPAHWDIIAHAAVLVKKYDSSKNRPLVLGNGDIKSVEEGFEKVARYGVDGVMVGRGLFGMPWFFRDIQALRDGKRPVHRAISTKKKMCIMLEHAALFEKLFSETKRFDVMKKHFKAYVHGFDRAKELRMKLMQTHTVAEIRTILKEEGYY